MPAASTFSVRPPTEVAMAPFSLRPLASAAVVGACVSMAALALAAKDSSAQEWTVSRCSDDLSLCRVAAEQGHAGAQHTLGVMHDRGEGVPEDDVEAARWYREAAEQRDATAQFILGDRYDRGGAVVGLTLTRQRTRALVRRGKGDPRSRAREGLAYALDGQVECRESRFLVGPAAIDGDPSSTLCLASR